MNDFRIRACGDDLLTFAVSTTALAQQLAQALRQSGNWLEVVGGIDSVVVQFDMATMSIATAIETLQAFAPTADFEHQVDVPLIEIEVHYGGEFGPDLGSVCASLSLTADELVALHCRKEHRVDMLGFTPGFAYLGGLDSRLNVPRLANPRQRIAAGSIGIAGGRSGIYALPGPGGWPIIGRTDLALFDAGADEPFLLQPGTRVRFVALTTSQT